jgi:ATP-binding cassette subfamily C protein LapB
MFAADPSAASPAPQAAGIEAPGSTPGSTPGGMPGGVASGAAPLRTDPLLGAFALVAQILERPVEAATLTAGFALDPQGRLPAAAYPDLARRHRLVASWARERPSRLPGHALPVIVPCSDGRAYVLRALSGDRATVLDPGSGEQELSLPVHELDAASQGEVLVVKALAQPADQTLVPFRGRAFGWLWGTLWRLRRFYVESMFAAVIANVLTLASVFFTMNVYDRVVPTQAYTSLWTLAIGAAVAALLEFAMRWLKARLVDLGGKRADLAINATLLREIMSIRLEHRPQSVGIFASSMRDFEALRDFCSSACLVLLTELPFAALFIALIFVIGGPIGWIPTLAVPLVVAIALLAQPALMRAMRENMKEAGDRQSVLVEAVLNLEALKAHNAEGYLQRRWEVANEHGADAYKRIRAMSNLIMGLTQTLQQLATIAMVVAGVYLIHAGALTLGGLIAAVILAGRAISPLGSLMGLAARYQQAATALQTLDGLMKRPRDRDDARQYLVAERRGGGCALELEELEFAYPGEPRLPVLRRVSLQLPAGARMALLGRVGSGKSTLLRVAAGLHEPQAGQVRADGLALQQIDPASQRARIGWVGQEPMLFMGTLRENLVLSDRHTPDSRILEVLQAIDLHALVTGHPRGLDRPLTEAGGGLSGGQRQLLSLARMMLRDPQLVFLDEPTSQMDQHTEARVIAALKAWLPGRTVLLATHRPQLLELVDAVAVLEAGQCLASGPKAQMLERLARGISVPGAAGGAA